MNIDRKKNTDISLCPLARRWLYVLRHDEEGDNGDGAFYGGYGADADDWMEIPLRFCCPSSGATAFSIPSMLQSCLRKSANLRTRIAGIRWLRL